MRQGLASAPADYVPSITNINVSSVGLVAGVLLIDVQQGHKLEPTGRQRRRTETEYSVSLSSGAQVSVGNQRKCNEPGPRK